MKALAALFGLLPALCAGDLLVQWLPPKADAAGFELRGSELRYRVALYDTDGVALWSSEVYTPEVLIPEKGASAPNLVAGDKRFVTVQTLYGPALLPGPTARMNLTYTPPKTLPQKPAEAATDLRAAYVPATGYDP
jgi:hypothetical protein